MHVCFYSPMSDDEMESAAPVSSNPETTVEFPKYIRSLRLSSDKLKKLGLRKGANEARFSITTKFQVCKISHLDVLYSHMHNLVYCVLCCTF